MMSVFRIIELIWLFVIGAYFFIPCYGFYIDHWQPYQQTLESHYTFHQPSTGKQLFQPHTQVNCVLKRLNDCRKPYENSASMPYLVVDFGCQTERI